ncbi:hypothetical protein RJG79_10685 [Mycoplasmatota bacterium WC44]
MKEIIDVREHSNPYDKALSELMKIIIDSGDDFNNVLDTVEVHGLTINETTSLFDLLHWHHDKGVTFIEVDGVKQPITRYILIRGIRRSEQRERRKRNLSFINDSRKAEM